MKQEAANHDSTGRSLNSSQYTLYHIGLGASKTKWISLAPASAVFWQYSFVAVASDGFLERSRGVACTSLSPLPSGHDCLHVCSIDPFCFCCRNFLVLRLDDLAKWQDIESDAAHCQHVSIHGVGVSTIRLVQSVGKAGFQAKHDRKLAMSFGFSHADVCVPGMPGKRGSHQWQTQSSKCIRTGSSFAKQLPGHEFQGRVMYFVHGFMMPIHRVRIQSHKRELITGSVVEVEGHAARGISP